MILIVERILGSGVVSLNALVGSPIVTKDSMFLTSDLCIEATALRPVRHPCLDRLSVPVIMVVVIPRDGGRKTYPNPTTETLLSGHM
jgi:hypothetical protein